MDKFLIGLLVIVFLYYYLKPGPDYEPTQQEIQDLTYVDKTKYEKEFPYPQISRSFQKLSKGKLPSPMVAKDILPSGSKDLKITRQLDTPDTIGTKRMYLPDYYRKDRLGSNPCGTEELRPFSTDDEESEHGENTLNKITESDVSNYFTG